MFPVPTKDRKQPLSEAERELFRNAMADVRPLSKQQEMRGPRAPTPGPPAGANSQKADAQKADATPATPPTRRPQESFRRPLRQRDAPPPAVPRQVAPSLHGNTWVFKRPGTRQREFDQLGRRHTKVTKTIDLHNHHLEEARHKLHAEISRYNATGHHVLRVIHGKGRHSPDHKSILREQVPRWLQAHPQVQGFRPSHRTGGGDGSLDVLLRRCPSPRPH